jgi:hypothetical protein
MRICVYFLIVLFTATVHTVSAEDGLKIFNYYHRNRDGTFILETIDESDLPVPLFRQKVLYSDDNIKSVTGFYYGTGKTKFIDEINKNKIVKSVYFDEKGKEISAWQYHYMKDVLYNISIRSVYRWPGLNGPGKLERRLHFEKDGDNNSNNFIFTEMSFIDIYGDNNVLKLSNYSFNKGLFDENYKPVSLSILDILTEPSHPARVIPAAEVDHRENSMEVFFLYDRQDGLLERIGTTSSSDGVFVPSVVRTKTDEGYILKSEIYNDGKLFQSVIYEWKSNYYTRQVLVDSYKKYENAPLFSRRILKIKDDLVLHYADGGDMIERILGNDEDIRIDGKKTIGPRVLLFPVSIYSIQTIYSFPETQRYFIDDDEYRNIEIKLEDKIKPVLKTDD